MELKHRIQRLQQQLSPTRQALVNHPLYPAIKNLHSLQVFMQHHVFAVWDFMSLLKALQQHLTCVSLPWVPVGSPAARYLVNEIVTGEESDIDEQGNRTSHFELYLRAMEQAGADTAPVQLLLSRLGQGQNIAAALQQTFIPPAARAFMQQTFKVVEDGQPHILAAVFTFGREDLIPSMFIEMVKEMSASAPGSTAIFLYYLERHIEVDGGHHAHLAHEMTAGLCGNDDRKWQEAADAALASMQARLALWDGILASIRE